MGFAAGSEAAANIVKSIIQNVDDPYTRKEIFNKVIDSFEELDCDTLDEVEYCFGVVDEPWLMAMQDHGYTIGWEDV